MQTFKSGKRSWCMAHLRGALALHDCHTGAWRGRRRLRRFTGLSVLPGVRSRHVQGVWGLGAVVLLRQGQLHGIRRAHPHSRAL